MPPRVLAVICALLLTAPAASVAARPPNLLLILADDLGYRDTGFTGSSYYETPNLDRLASRGMVFQHAYAGAGNCAPSRACLHSGQYSPRTGVYAVGRTDRGPKDMMRLVPIPNREDLAKENFTIAEALKAAGYATGLFGKWHLSGEPGTKPTEQGFDEFVDPRAPNPNRRRDDPADPKGIYSLTRAAAAFMRRHQDRPFFAFVSHHAIHSALEARPSSLARFKSKPTAPGQANALYAACVYDLDDGVGELLRVLDELKLTDNTLVVFTSDNGGTPQSSQEPLRGNKGCYYEGGIREPFIAVWPGRIPAGKVSSVPIINVDLYPTFLAAAGAPVPAGKTLDGVSLLPLFLDPAAELNREGIYWHFPGYLDAPVTRGRDPVFRTRPVSAMRAGDWKLLLYHEEWVLDGGLAQVPMNRAVELYNLASDPGERHDLAALETTRRDALLAQLLKWQESVGAPMPRTINPKFNPVAKPPTSFNADLD
jgi:arylsulfatase A-like enzyme